MEEMQDVLLSISLTIKITSDFLSHFQFFPSEINDLTTQLAEAATFRELTTPSLDDGRRLMKAFAQI